MRKIGTLSNFSAGTPTDWRNQINVVATAFKGWFRHSREGQPSMPRTVAQEELLRVATDS